MRKQKGRKRTGGTNTRNFLPRLGPGLITGASDDDPSGIATYSQSGARFGYSLLWTMAFRYPLVIAIQEISARIGRTTVSQRIWPDTIQTGFYRSS